MLAFYIVFCYVPMGGLVMGFQNYKPNTGILRSSWVGVKHFIDFFHDMYFPRLMRNTFMLNVYDIIVGFPALIILALLLNELRGKYIKGGILAFFGKEPNNLLQNPKLFKPVFVATNLWQYAGWNSIIYIAAISGINTELYDAAYVDGCGRWKRLLYVTLPGLFPTIVIMFILRIGNIMTVGFEKVILLYNPLTYETADVISSYVYRRGILEANYGYATAVGLFNSLINFAFL